MSGLDDILGGGLPRTASTCVGRPGRRQDDARAAVPPRGRAARRAGALRHALGDRRTSSAPSPRSHGWSLDGSTICELTSAPRSALPSPRNRRCSTRPRSSSDETTRVAARRGRARQARRASSSTRSRRCACSRRTRCATGGRSSRSSSSSSAAHCTVLLLDDRHRDAGDLQLAEPRPRRHRRWSSSRPEYGAERRRLRVDEAARASRFRGGYHDFASRRGGLDGLPAARRRRARRAVRDASPCRAASPSSTRCWAAASTAARATLFIGPAGTGKSRDRAAVRARRGGARGARPRCSCSTRARRPSAPRARRSGWTSRRRSTRAASASRQIDPAELAPGEFAHVDAARRRGATTCDVVVIDSLNGYLNAMPEERFLTLQLHELLTYLGQTRRGHDRDRRAARPRRRAGASPVDVSYLADTVVLLRYFEAEGAVRKAISVVKKRTGAHEHTIRELTLDHGGVHVGQPLDAVPGRADRRAACFAGPRAGGRRGAMVHEPGRAQRVLVLAPPGRDAALTCAIAARGGHRRPRLRRRPPRCGGSPRPAWARSARRGGGRRTATWRRSPACSRGSRPGPTSRSWCFAGAGRRASRGASCSTGSAARQRDAPRSAGQPRDARSARCESALRARQRQYEVRELLRAGASLEPRDQFLAMLGHELRNPLAAICNTLHAIDLGNADNERRDAHARPRARPDRTPGRAPDARSSTTCSTSRASPRARSRSSASRSTSATSSTASVEAMADAARVARPHARAGGRLPTPGRRADACASSR